jgi:hypothetical protein
MISVLNFIMAKETWHGFSECMKFFSKDIFRVLYFLLMYYVHYMDSSEPENETLMVLHCCRGSLVLNRLSLNHFFLFFAAYIIYLSFCLSLVRQE